MSRRKAGHFVMSHRPTVVGPVEYRLTLTRSTSRVPHPTIALDLHNVTTDRLPSLNLSLVFPGDSSAHIVAAVPLKPASRIIFINPPLLLPYRERLRGIYPKIIELRIMLFGRELHSVEPCLGELLRAVGHILPAKYAELQHLGRREIGFKVFRKILPHGFTQGIPIPSLH